MHPTPAHRCAPSAHTLARTQRGAIIDGAQLTRTKGVLSALTIEDALYHMGHIFVDITYRHP